MLEVLSPMSGLLAQAVTGDWMMKLKDKQLVGD
jgi:hypothetical protein